MEPATRTAVLALPVSLLLALGLAWAGSRHGQMVFDLPLFGLCVGLSLLIQWMAFVPAYVFRTEKFFDLAGSLTFLSLVVAALWLGNAPDARAWLLGGLVIIWAVRLGSFLFSRIHAAGSDRRFDEIKTSFPRFLLAWTMQGLWVAFSLAAALAAITSTRQLGLDVWAGAGFLVWLAGFSIEVIADYQKSQFRKKPENKDRFIQSGLWALSRHPNYFGEIVLWMGIAVIAFPVLLGWQYVTLLSPVFVALLLTKVSGIPLLEERADEKWGGQTDYERYKAETPVLVPKWPGL